MFTLVVFLTSKNRYPLATSNKQIIFPQVYRLVVHEKLGVVDVVCFCVCVHVCVRARVCVDQQYSLLLRLEEGPGAKAAAAAKPKLKVALTDNTCVPLPLELNRFCTFSQDAHFHLILPLSGVGIVGGLLAHPPFRPSPGAWASKRLLRRVPMTTVPNSSKQSCALADRRFPSERPPPPGSPSASHPRSRAA